MGDPRRFDVFARLISERIDPRTRVVDVAGGKGYLQAALRQRGFVDVTSWDKRKKYGANTRGYRWGWFTCDAKERYDAVVAMHPDGGTDHAILYAAAHRVPAIVCPCCAVGSAAAYWGPRGSYERWWEHLCALADGAGLNVETVEMPIDGRRRAMILTPRDADGSRKIHTDLST